MAYTEAQRDALKAALASGVRTVTYDGTTTTYRDLDEVRSILGEINAELSVAAGKKTTRQIRVIGKRGY